jgi:regulator of sigma E protease
MGTLITLLAFAFALGVIIVVHEAGHLWVAKACSVRVLAFSVGFGKRLFGIERNGTDYRLSALPLGGYVKLAGEGVEDGPSDDPQDFQNRPRWQRILVYLAGPAMNVVFSFLLFAVLFTLGLTVQRRPETPPVVGAVTAGSPAALAGVAPGDRIRAIDGSAVGEWGEALSLLQKPSAGVRSLELLRGGRQLSASMKPRAQDGNTFTGIIPNVVPQIVAVVEGGRAEAAGLQRGDGLRSLDGLTVVDAAWFTDYVSKRPEKPIVFEIERDGRALTLPVAPKKEGAVGRVGLGIGFYERHSVGSAFAASAGYNGYIVRSTLSVLGRVVTGRLAPTAALSGPIGIAKEAGAAARRGFKDLLHTMGILSLSIAILNLLPIPLLDGGQILTLMIESAIRRDLPLKVKEVVGYIGFGAIIALMLFTLWIDLPRLLHR